MSTDSESNQGLSSRVERPSSQHSSQLVSPSPSPFDKLATETIEQIFLEACYTIFLPAQKPRTLGKTYAFGWVADPLILLVVCRRWYTIMKAYHLIWSTIEVSSWSLGVSVNGEEEWNQWGTAQLRDRLNRSGKHPLQIHILGDGAGLPGILEAIMPHSERWKTVDINFELGHVFLDFLRDRQFPHLESINFIPTMDILTQAAINRANLSGILLGAPSLTSIRFNQSTSPVNVSLVRNLPWSQLSTVVFDGNRFDTKADLLELFQHLSVSVTTLSFLSIFSPKFKVGERSITLPKLRRLRVEGGYQDGLLTVLACPSLEWLNIEVAFEDELLYFFNSNSSCVLKHIHLHYIQPTFRGLSPYLIALRAPPSSTLRSISLGEPTDPVLELLVYDSDQRFPFLETLRLDLKFGRQPEGNQYLASRVEGLRKIVESRTRVSHESSTPVHTLQSRCDRNNDGWMFKNCFIDLYLEGPDDDGAIKSDNYWDLKPLEALHRLCLARGVYSRQVISPKNSVVA